MNINLKYKPDWFLQKAPRGLVPVLEKDDKVRAAVYCIGKIVVLVHTSYFIQHAHNHCLSNAGFKVAVSVRVNIDISELRSV